MAFYYLLALRTWDALIHPRLYARHGRRKLLAYLRQGLVFRNRLRVARKVRFETKPPLHVILSSYKREANMRYVLEPFLLLPYVEKIIITNNNPASRLRLGKAGQDPRVSLLEHARPMSSGYRFDLAYEAEAEHYLLVDDDTLLTPQQIDLLYQAYLAAPGRPHGIQGEVWQNSEGNGKLCSVSGEQEVDVLNRCYLIDRSMLNNMRTLMNHFGISDARHLYNAEDLFISFSGESRPMIHDIGPWLDCPTGYKSDTAIWLVREDFYTERNLVYRHLAALREEPARKIEDRDRIAALLGR